MADDAWMETALIGISIIGSEEVQFNSIVETADFDVGEKDIEGLALVNGGRVTKHTPEGDSSVTFEVYPMEAGAGEGFFDLLHGNGDIVSGTATGTNANDLIDSSVDFVVLGVKVGDRITNVTDTTYATVTAIEDANTLSVSADVFASADEYTITRGVRIVNGTTDGTTSGKLVDSGETFTNRIAVGDSVRNTTDNTEAKVTAIDDANTLSLSANIMTSGEDYIISESPQRVINNRVREKARILVLWTDKTAPVKASEAIANSLNAFRMGYANGHFSSVKPSFTDGALKFTVTYKCAAFSKSGDSNVMMESCAAGGGSDALPVIADYTTSNTFG